MSGTVMNRRSFLRRTGIGAMAMMCGGSVFATAGKKKKPNVLFIAVDDMADWPGCVGGHPDAITPNIDRLANRGVLFTNAHCVSPICGPSRASVLTGQRPETTNIYTNKGTYSDYVPEAVALPLHFKKNGYHVAGSGKINHSLGMVNPELWHEYGPDCGVIGTPFTEEEFLSAGLENGQTRRIKRDGMDVVLPMNGGISLIDRPTMTWDTFDWGPIDVPDDQFPDGKIANWGAEQVQKKYDKPFFTAVGFYRPHQPLFAPKKYFEMYDPMKITLPPTIAGDLNDVPDAGKDFAGAAWSAGRHETVTKMNQWRQGVVGYLASITFADAQVGKVLDSLDRGEHADDTWIILWSDHGWSLGQKEHWGKHDPWKASLRVPMIIVPPKNADVAGFKAGSRCEAPVSLLDIYPTLIDACGLPKRRELEGRSLLPLVRNIEAKWDDAVVASIGRGTHSVFVKGWRYIHYFDGSEELYDLSVDSEEWFNLAGDEQYTDVKIRLAKHIPVDKRFKQFVRWGRWKYIVKTDGSIMLFDIHQVFGISEHFEVSKENPEVVEQIRSYLKENNITARHVAMPVK
ncbi:MAG: sulfatase [Anaerohalosphaera sp.]|nr:sulfatase [Anaerohalosphaera sp.]